jgi:hypothetical protein
MAQRVTAQRGSKTLRMQSKVEHCSCQARQNSHPACVRLQIVLVCEHLLDGHARQPHSEVAPHRLPATQQTHLLLGTARLLPRPSHPGCCCWGRPPRAPQQGLYLHPHLLPDQQSTGLAAVLQIQHRALQYRRTWCCTYRLRRPKHTAAWRGRGPGLQGLVCCR